MTDEVFGSPTEHERCKAIADAAVLAATLHYYREIYGPECVPLDPNPERTRRDYAAFEIFMDRLLGPSRG